jgi:general secretion pathway protein G
MVLRQPRLVAQADMNAIGAALETFRHDVGRYPTNREGLEALVSQPDSMSFPGDWLGPYLVVPPPVDPWGGHYVYRRVGNDTSEYYCLISYCADGRPGGIGADADVLFQP